MSERTRPRRHRLAEKEAEVVGEVTEACSSSRRGCAGRARGRPQQRSLAAPLSVRPSEAAEAPGSEAAGSPPGGPQSDWGSRSVDKQQSRGACFYDTHRRGRNDSVPLWFRGRDLNKKVVKGAEAFGTRRASNTNSPSLGVSVSAYVGLAEKAGNE